MRVSVNKQILTGFDCGTCSATNLFPIERWHQALSDRLVRHSQSLKICTLILAFAINFNQRINVIYKCYHFNTYNHATTNLAICLHETSQDKLPDA